MAHSGTVINIGGDNSGSGFQSDYGSRPPISPSSRQFSKSDDLGTFKIGGPHGNHSRFVYHPTEGTLTPNGSRSPSFSRDLPSPAYDLPIRMLPDNDNYPPSSPLSPLPRSPSPSPGYHTLTPSFLSVATERSTPIPIGRPSSSLSPPEQMVFSPEPRKDPPYFPTYESNLSFPRQQSQFNGGATSVEFSPVPDGSRVGAVHRFQTEPQVVIVNQDGHVQPASTLSNLKPSKK
ncbi:uncharacterized protein LOC129589676 [Paramacrobiotus metropolitanus]|uniref:uncharacterized protein LOC129589676 n=1 Tax=Paramacrobiotus metropolitanus TaxID=2943436 RepID=UPI002446246A|nr:uncharacterized protein LOC129589676 [Paramacrobiotus metropolitanus]